MACDPYTQLIPTLWPCIELREAAEQVARSSMHTHTLSHLSTLHVLIVSRNYGGPSVGVRTANSFSPL